ncbi:hypothetical protein ACLOJK_016684 [Asimina triloba]
MKPSPKDIHKTNTATNIQMIKVEEGNINAASPTPEGMSRRPAPNWCLLSLNCTLNAIGTICGPLLLRLYYLHGGSRKWLTSWLQTAAFPLLLPPLYFLYKKHRQTQNTPFLAEPKLLISSAVIGLLIGLNNFLYSQGLSLLPVSTSSLLFATQLAFTAFFALIIVRQKFSPYSVNAVVLMTLGSVLLALRKSSDRPANVSSAEYTAGFLVSLGAAALLGLTLPCIELAYAKANRAITYAVLLQFQLGTLLFATLFCTIGMIINKDFEAIAKEAREYGLGEATYYLVLIGCAIVFEMVFVGALGIIFCGSSLFVGVFSSALLPLTEIAAVIAFKEKFNGEKGLALALSLWGFTSYFYGSYKTQKKTMMS